MAKDEELQMTILKNSYQIFLGMQTRKVKKN